MPVVFAIKLQLSKISVVYLTKYKVSNIMDFFHTYGRIPIQHILYGHFSIQCVVWTFYFLWTFSFMDIIPYGHFTLWTICRFTLWSTLIWNFFIVNKNTQHFYRQGIQKYIKYLRSEDLTRAFGGQEQKGQKSAAGWAGLTVPYLAGNSKNFCLILIFFIFLNSLHQAVTKSVMKRAR